ncbi:MAG: DUF1643 domain-containing protein [Novosphingobium sp.]
MTGDVLGTAIFSPCGTYRYRLERPPPADRESPVLAFIMVNPSTADEHQDDQTIRMVRLFGRRHGYGRLLVGNIFAYRSQDIGQLELVEGPVGPENDHHLEAIMRESDRCYVAWGAEAKLPSRLRGRWREVVRLADRIGCTLFCLDHLNGGHPRHPQILQYSNPDLLWTRPQ